MTNQTIASMMENVTWLVLHHLLLHIKTTGSGKHFVTVLSVSLKYSFFLQSVVIHNTYRCGTS